MQEQEHGNYRDDQKGCLPCCSEEERYPSDGYSVESGGAEPTERNDNIQYRTYAIKMMHEHGMRVQDGILLELTCIRFEVDLNQIQISLQTRYSRIPF